MKKILAVILSLVIGLAAMVGLAGCSEDGDKLKISVHVPTQTPSLAILKMLSDNEQIDSDKYEITYELQDGSAGIQASMVTGKADVVIAPTNIIASLYSQPASQYTIAAATSLGAFYIISTDPDVTDLEDLTGKEIHCQGAAGGANDKILEFLLEENEVENVTRTFSPAANTTVINNENTVGMFPEPAFTAVKNALTTQGKSFTVIDIQDEWQKATGSDSEGYPLACLAFRKDFLEENLAFCLAFADKVEESIEWISQTPAADVAEVLTEVNERGYGELNTGVNPTTLLDSGAIGRLNISFVPANRTEIEEYLKCVTPLTDFEDGMFYIR